MAAACHRRPTDDQPERVKSIGNNCGESVLLQQIHNNLNKTEGIRSSISQLWDHFVCAVVYVLYGVFSVLFLSCRYFLYFVFFYLESGLLSFNPEILVQFRLD